MQMRHRSRQWGDKRPHGYFSFQFFRLYMRAEATHTHKLCHRRSFNFLVLFAHLNISGAALAATFGAERETHSKSGEIFAGLIARAPTAAAHHHTATQANWSSNSFARNERKAHTLAVNKCIAQFFRLSFTRTPRLAETHILYDEVSHFYLVGRRPRPEMDKLRILLVCVRPATFCCLGIFEFF